MKKYAESKKENAINTQNNSKAITKTKSNTQSQTGDKRKGKTGAKNSFMRNAAFISLILLVLLLLLTKFACGNCAVPEQEEDDVAFSNVLSASPLDFSQNINTDTPLSSDYDKADQDSYDNDTYDNITRVIDSLDIQSLDKGIRGGGGIGRLNNLVNTPSHICTYCANCNNCLNCGNGFCPLCCHHDEICAECSECLSCGSCCNFGDAAQSEVYSDCDIDDNCYDCDACGGDNCGCDDKYDDFDDYGGGDSGGGGAFDGSGGDSGGDSGGGDRCREGCGCENCRCDNCGDCDSCFGCSGDDFGAWSDWQDDGGTHSRERNCNHCGIAERDAHIENWGDWQSDESDHWRGCRDCGIYEPKSAHSFTAWSDGGGQCIRHCDDCGHEDNQPHEYGVWSDGGGHCVRHCGDCGHEDKQPHEYGVWSDGGNHSRVRSCNHCGAAERDAHIENWGDWQSDEIDHWRGCRDCGIYESKSAHSFTAWSDGGGQCVRHCDDCGHEDNQPHEYGVWSDGGDQCVRHCEYCGHKDNQPHEYGVWSDWQDDGEFGCMRESFCDRCGAIHGQFHTTKLGTYASNAFEHWQICDICGRKDDLTIENHIYSTGKNNGNGTCTRPCDVCAYETTAEHSLSAGNWSYNSGNDRCYRNVSCRYCSYFESESHRTAPSSNWSTSPSGHWKVCVYQPVNENGHPVGSICRASLNGYHGSGGHAWNPGNLHVCTVCSYWRANV
ncbi:MAG: hypothetical protein FWH17_03120 [Oscillospiraceae bacterium]|nr:hypothetical protein [Oscillospiraceae bacterium]